MTSKGLDLNAGVLQLDSISKRYPGVQALSEVSLTVSPGRVQGLIGENGAGKSTLIRIMAGIETPDTGTIRLNGQEITLTPRGALSHGISVVFQEMSLVPSLSVAENIYFGDLPANGPLVRWRETLEGARRWCERVGVDVNPRTPVNRLSVAQRQLVEIAKTLAREPRIVAFDEPTSALSTAEIDHLHLIIRSLVAEGVGVLYVSHKLEELFGLTDAITVLRDGALISDMNTADLTEETVISSMVGRDVANFHARQASHARYEQPPLLVADAITTDRVRDVSFEVHPGEVLGFAGLMGAGRTELARALFGLDRLKHGTITVAGHTRSHLEPWDAVRAGVGYVPEERKSDGLFAQSSVRDNVSIAGLDRFASGGFLRSEKERNAVTEIVGSLRVKTDSIQRLISTLSGGNQQKVVLGRWLINPELKVLILDEPTRGIDVNAKSEIYEWVENLAGEGLGVILMSSELPELISMADRVCVMAGGTVVETLDKGQITEERIMSTAVSEGTLL